MIKLTFTLSLVIGIVIVIVIITIGYVPRGLNRVRVISHKPKA